MGFYWQLAEKVSLFQGHWSNVILVMDLFSLCVTWPKYLLHIAVLCDNKGFIDKATFNLCVLITVRSGMRTEQMSTKLKKCCVCLQIYCLRRDSLMVKNNSAQIWPCALPPRGFKERSCGLVSPFLQSECYEFS